MSSRPSMSCLESTRRRLIKGYTQNPIEGESFAAALTDPSVPGKATQFYAMLGHAPSITRVGSRAASPTDLGWSNFEKDEWELYHLETDRAQSRMSPADQPERLAKLKDLWFYYAGIFNGLPLDDRLALEMVLADRPNQGRTARGIRTIPIPPMCRSRRGWRSMVARTR